MVAYRRVVLDLPIFDLVVSKTGGVKYEDTVIV